MKNAVVAVVEDDVVVRIMIGELLADDGYQVQVWTEDEDTLDFVDRVQPDLLVLDLWVGAARRGWQLLDQLRANPRHAMLPVIICSGDVGALEAEAPRLDADRCATLPKPFELDHMLQQVQRLLAAYPQP